MTLTTLLLVVLSPWIACVAIVLVANAGLALGAAVVYPLLLVGRVVEALRRRAPKTETWDDKIARLTS